MRILRPLLPVVVIGVLFLAAMLRATGGRPSLPVDDSFIYFQYASEAAAGRPLVYQAGDAPTTGATSLPWLGVLALGSLLGFEGKALVFLALLLGGGLLTWTVRRAGAAEGAILGAAGESAPGSARPDGLPVFGLPLASVLVLLSGPLHWGFWSGMEIALFAAILTVTFHAWCRAGGRAAPGVAVWSAVLATVRPEGALLAAGIALLWLVNGALDRSQRRGWAWALVPLAACWLQPLANLAATGELRSAGFIAKTLLSAPGADPVGVLRVAVLRAFSLGAALFGGIAPLADGLGLYAYESEAAVLFVAPGAFVLFLIGALPAAADEWRRRRAGAGSLALLWFATLLLATCLLEEPDAHFSRYQMPILPIVLIFTAVGVARLGRALREAPGALRHLARGVRGWLLLCGALSVLFYAAAYADNCEDIDRMQIRLAETIRDTLPPDAVVAINDAGALTYFSDRRTVDLVGLVSPGFAGLWPQGSGVLWEKLESLPAERRPGWFCFFPNWFELDDIGLWRRQGSVRLRTPSIVDAEKVLARADWSLAGSGERPRLALVGEAAGDGESGEAPTAAPAPLDRLDVADPASERAHDFRLEEPEHGARVLSFVRRAGFADRPGDEAIDGGRTVYGAVSFTVARPATGAAALVLRSVTGVRQRLLVSVDDGPLDPVELYAPGPGRFHEQVVATLAAGPEPARIRVAVVPAAAGSAPLILTHVFVLPAPDG